VNSNNLKGYSNRKADASRTLLGPFRMVFHLFHTVANFFMEAFHVYDDYDREWLFRGNHPQIITFSLRRCVNKPFGLVTTSHEELPITNKETVLSTPWNSVTKKLPTPWQTETKNFWSYCESLEQLRWRNSVVPLAISEKELNVSWRKIVPMKSGGKTLKSQNNKWKNAFQTDDILWQRKSSCLSDK
jgi:hypothetical protein